MTPQTILAHWFTKNKTFDTDILSHASSAEGIATCNN